MFIQLKRKLCDADFISYIKTFDILFFGETWLNKDDPYDFDISGCECAHVDARKSHGAKTGRFSGGVIVYYNSALKQYISVASKSDNGLVWIKIDKHILISDQDAYICYVYVHDKNSRVLRQEEIDYFELLQADIVKYKSLGASLFVTGDFNSRVGQSSELRDYLLYDHYLNVGVNEHTRDHDIPPCKSRDLVLDNYGLV